MGVAFKGDGNKSPPNPKKLYRAALELSNQCDSLLKSSQIIGKGYPGVREIILEEEAPHT